MKFNINNSKEIFQSKTIYNSHATVFIDINMWAYIFSHNIAFVATKYKYVTSINLEDVSLTVIIKFDCNILC